LAVSTDAQALPGNETIQLSPPLLHLQPLARPFLAGFSWQVRQAAGFRAGSPRVAESAGKQAAITKFTRQGIALP
jgi:hypothetical protein